MFMEREVKTDSSVANPKSKNEHLLNIFQKAMADIESLTDEELTELILFYVQPEVLTDGGANAFREIVSNGSVLYSTISKTKETDKTVSFFNAVKWVYDEIYNVDAENVLWEDYDSAGEFFLNYIGKDKSEVFCAAFVNSKGGLIKIEKFTVERADLVSAGIDKIIMLAKGCKAHKVVIAHNHPSGYVGFSKEDWDSTKTLLSVFEAMNISLVEHYAVACNGYYGIFRRFNKDNLPLAEGMR
jgi:DNA repair protein RadC